ncbi:MAG: hypothetical protein P8P49_09725 [Opitutales bacterium]|nr:hypothetical protein [Opitutales bacterium]
MKGLSFLTALSASFLLLQSAGYGQAINSLKGQPSRPGYANFHSNLGLQEIIEVGVPVKVGQIAQPKVVAFPASKGLGERAGKETEIVTPKPNTNSQPGWFTKSEAPAEPESVPVSNAKSFSGLDFSASAGLRAYQTSNVLRVNSGEQESGVLESNIGGAITRSGIKVGEYVTMIPRLDVMMQWANYGEDTVSDLLDYRFTLAKASFAFSFPKEWTLTPAVEYNLLNSQSSGDRMFDAFAPSINLQKATVFDEQSILLYDISLKYNKTDKVISFNAPGVFADDGDNIQYSLNLTYIKLFGEENQWMLMPSFGVTRSAYQKNTHEGRTDYLVNLGVTGIYQWKPWLGFQTFINYTNMSTNDKGEVLLLSSSSSKTVDVGVAVTGNYQF